MSSAKLRLPLVARTAETLLNTLCAKAVNAARHRPLPVAEKVASLVNPIEELVPPPSGPVAAAPPAVSSAAATGLPARPDAYRRRNQLTGHRATLAALRADLNNPALPPPVRARQLYRYRCCFYELAAECFRRGQVLVLAAYMRHQLPALRRWTQELYGVCPEPALCSYKVPVPGKGN